MLNQRAGINDIACKTTPPALPDVREPDALDGHLLGHLDAGRAAARVTPPVRRGAVLGAVARRCRCTAPRGRSGWRRSTACIGRRGADVVFDPVAGDVFDASLRCLA